MLAGVKVLAQGRTRSEMEVRWSRVVGREKEASSFGCNRSWPQSQGYRSLDQDK